MIRTMLVWLLWSTAALAQGLGGPEHDSSLPVEITAAALDVDQTAGTAQFKGDVLAGQGSLRIKADQLLVEYVIADGKATRDIRQMTATGNVTLSNGVEAAEGQKAVYTVADGKVLMTGDVLLTQGDSAIAGETLNIDLDTGEARVEGNVRTVIQPEDNQ